jgi:hypothetical protein
MITNRLAHNLINGSKSTSLDSYEKRDFWPA